MDPKLLKEIATLGTSYPHLEKSFFFSLHLICCVEVSEERDHLSSPWFMLPKCFDIQNNFLIITSCKDSHVSWMLMYWHDHHEVNCQHRHE